jgi:hypothetical protein
MCLLTCEHNENMRANKTEQPMMLNKAQTVRVGISIVRYNLAYSEEHPVSRGMPFTHDILSCF